MVTKLPRLQSHQQYKRSPAALDPLSKQPPAVSPTDINMLDHNSSTWHNLKKCCHNIRCRTHRPYQQLHRIPLVSVRRFITTQLRLIIKMARYQ